MGIEQDFVILVGGDHLGRGDEAMGRLLMEKFLHELAGARRLPETVIFMNTAVRLVIDDSPVLDQLKRLDEAGVEIRACTTCLRKWNLLDRVAVGEQTNMRSLVDYVTQASRFITL